jgi:hypothetical protein
LAAAPDRPVRTVRRAFSGPKACAMEQP